MPPARHVQTNEISTIGLVEARILADICLDLASAYDGKPISFTVADALGEPIVVHRMDGASLDSMSISQAKARAAARSKNNTVTVRFQMTEDRQEWHLRPEEELRRIESEAASRRAAGHNTYVTWAGGCVVRKRGVVLGAIGVSGRDQLEDHDLGQTTTNRWLHGYMKPGDSVRIKSNHGTRHDNHDVSQHIGILGVVKDAKAVGGGSNQLCVVQIGAATVVSVWDYDLEHE